MNMQGKRLAAALAAVVLLTHGSVLADSLTSLAESTDVSSTTATATTAAAEASSSTSGEAATSLASSAESTSPPTGDATTPSPTSAEVFISTSGEAATSLASSAESTSPPTGDATTPSPTSAEVFSSTSGEAATSLASSAESTSPPTGDATTPSPTSAEVFSSTSGEAATSLASSAESTSPPTGDATTPSPTSTTPSPSTLQGTMSLSSSAETSSPTGVATTSSSPSPPPPPAAPPPESSPSSTASKAQDTVDLLFIVTLPMSAEDFEARRDQYQASVALALRLSVPTTAVSIISVKTVGSTKRRAAGGLSQHAFPRRKLLAASVEVETDVKNVSHNMTLSKENLDAELQRHGLPASESFRIINKAGLDVTLVVGASVGGGTGLLLMCVSLAALRRCRASSTTKLPKASAAVSAEGKAELIEQQHGVHQQQTMAWGGEEGDVQDGEKGTHEELPPPRTQLSPDPRYQPATDANVEAGTFPCPETSTPSPAKRRLRALAPLPNRVASLEQKDLNQLEEGSRQRLTSNMKPLPRSPGEKKRIERSLKRKKEREEG